MQRHATYVCLSVCLGQRFLVCLCLAQDTHKKCRISHTNRAAERLKFLLNMTKLVENCAGAAPYCSKSVSACVRVCVYVECVWIRSSMYICLANNKNRPLYTVIYFRTVPEQLADQLTGSGPCKEPHWRCWVKGAGDRSISFFGNLYAYKKLSIIFLHTSEPLCILHISVPPDILHIRVPPDILHIRVPPDILHIRVPPDILPVHLHAVIVLWFSWSIDL